MKMSRVITRLATLLAASLCVIGPTFTAIADDAALEGADADQLIKSIQEQIDYIAAQPLGSPPLLLKSVEVELTLVGEQTAGGGNNLQDIVF
jgi:hypothetical protein